MSSIFDPRIKISTPSMNIFNGSYYNRVTGVMGDLIPVLNKEVVPSDQFRVSLDTIMRLCPMLNPVYDRVYQDFHAFFVPNRIIDKDWKEFITGGVGLSNSVDTDIAPLQFNLRNLIEYNSGVHNGANVSSLADYLNLHFPAYTDTGAPASFHEGKLAPISKDTPWDSDVYLSAYPFLGYAKIWDDWYRNERIQNPIFDTWSATLSDDSRIISSNGAARWELLGRNYAKDLYTTALPEPVIGGPVSFLPDENIKLQSTVSIPVPTGVSTDDSKNVIVGGSGSPSSLFVNLSNAAQATVQQLLTAFKMYSFFMKDTYNGNRYVEFIQSHFNRRVPDSTLDRPIYLGSFRNPVQFGEVYQTSGSTDPDSNALGDYAGRGAAAGSGFMFDTEFLEHGQIYIIMSIVPEATYFQGIDRKFFKKDRFDFLFPEFQNIGDASINSAELYSFKNAAQFNKDVFGFNTRWYEYKNFMNEIHGDFLPLNGERNTNLATWLFARQFTSQPVISDTFSKIQPQNAPFTVLDSYADNYIVDIKFNIRMCRPLMYYETF